MTIPVTILSGFLGAGKTSFLNYILKHSPVQADRVLVLVNEIGDISIDHQLIVHNRQQIYQLKSGCMCCSIQGDLIASLINIHQQLQQGMLDIDYLIIECTGIANPIPVAQASNSAVTDSLAFYVDAIYSLVDSQHYRPLISRQPEIIQQIIGADRIYLTKGGNDEDLETLQAINPMVEISRLDLSKATEANRFFDQKLHGQFNRQGLQVPRDAYDHYDHHAHNHHDGISSLSLQAENPLRSDYLQSFIDWLLTAFGQDLYRYKGIIQFKDLPQAMALQGVQMDYHFQPLDDDSVQETQLVIIGHDLNHQAIQATWQELCQASLSDRPY